MEGIDCKKIISLYINFQSIKNLKGNCCLSWSRITPNECKSYDPIRRMKG